MKNHISEDFVQFVWKFSLFSSNHLALSDGRTIQIIHPGTQNKSSGPDFFNAKIYIADTLWVGNVEIHIHTKHWKLHKHQIDTAYNNIILHVVYEDNIDSIILENGREVPTISIGNLVYTNTP